MRKITLIYMIAVIICALCVSCSSSAFPQHAVIMLEDISGEYVSKEEVGSLGQLHLELAKFEDTRTVYEAVMGGSGLVEGGSEAVGTLADNHMILNFDRGFESDFYYEGFVTETLVGFEITGQFVFPDESRTLDADFVTRPGF